MNIKKTLSELWADTGRYTKNDMGPNDYEKYYNTDFKKHHYDAAYDWIIEQKTYHHTKKPNKKIPKGHVGVRVVSLKSPPSDLAVYKCACHDTRSPATRSENGKPDDYLLVVRRDVRDYIDEHRIYTHAVLEGLAMSEKDLAILLLKFK